MLRVTHAPTAALTGDPWDIAPTPAPSQSPAVAVSGWRYPIPSSSSASRRWWRTCWGARCTRTTQRSRRSAAWTSRAATGTRRPRRLRRARAGACAAGSTPRVRTALCHARRAWSRRPVRETCSTPWPARPRGATSLPTRRTAGPACCAMPWFAWATPPRNACSPLLPTGQGCRAPRSS